MDYQTQQPGYNQHYNNQPAMAQPPQPKDAYSVGDAGAANRAAQAHHAAAHVVGTHQKVGKKVDTEQLARIVAEENEAKGKLPLYPGLERYKLVEKMGDGAFSNVYRAVDLEGGAGEVAIKVVRKFEMNSTQVSLHSAALPY